jgi:hypothetical protein
MQTLRSILFPFIVIFLALTVHFKVVAKSDHWKDKSQYQSGNVVPNVIVIKFAEDYQISENSINTKSPAGLGSRERGTRGSGNCYRGRWNGY